MTRKDFELVAKLLRKELLASLDLATSEMCGKMGAVESLAKGFANYFAESNPRFDRSRFMRAISRHPGWLSSVGEDWEQEKDNEVW